MEPIVNPLLEIPWRDVKFVSIAHHENAVVVTGKSVQVIRFTSEQHLNDAYWEWLKQCGFDA
jgi:hypothetical protein